MGLCHNILDGDFDLELLKVKMGVKAHADLLPQSGASDKILKIHSV